MVSAAETLDCRKRDVYFGPISYTVKTSKYNTQRYKNKMNWNLCVKICIDKEGFGVDYAKINCKYCHALDKTISSYLAT